MPLAVSVVELPEHIVGGAETVRVGVVFTVTVMFSGEALQVPLAPFTV